MRNNIFKSLSYYFLLCLLALAIVAIPTNQVNASNDSTPKTVLESVNADDLHNHPELLQYIEELKEKGVDVPSNDELGSSLVEQNERTLASEDTEGGELKERIKNYYGLEEQGREEVVEGQYLYTKTESSSDSAAISSLWYLGYTTNSEGFEIHLINIIGKEIDAITGSVELQTLNRDVWQAGTTKGFSKSKIKSGEVLDWDISPTYVAEAFVYSITVLEDGTWYQYSNAGNYNQVRYNFAGGSYGPMQALGGERHHIVSSASLTSAGFSSYSGPAVRMIYKDHVTTPNYGSSTAAKNYRAQELQFLNNKEYQKLLDFTVANLKSSPDPGGGYSSLAAKYSDALSDALLYAHSYFGIPVP